MSQAGATNVQIVVMDHHFLYLPLYYAKNKQFFGFIPDSYSIEIVPSADSTDVSAFEMLMDTTSEKNKRVAFALMDPASAFNYFDSSGAAPAVLAALITSAAFWAIDRRSRRVEFLKDLAAFDTIIAYKEGTTSYGIARRIFRDAKKQGSIRTVRLKQEFTALQESEQNVVALSPDILGIDNFLYHDEKKKFDIDLALGNTAEYSNVLITALLSRRDVVEQHRDLVLGLLKALQQALFHVKLRIPDLVEYATHRFGGAKDRVTSALSRAEESHVFPPDIEVTEAHWLNAARVAGDASGGVSIGEGYQSKAKRSFQIFVQPYLYLTKAAVKEIYSRVPIPSKEEPSWKQAMPSVLMMLFWLGVGGVAATWSHPAALVVVPVVAVVAQTVAAWLRLKRWCFEWFLHWGFCVSFAALISAALTLVLQGAYDPTTIKWLTGLAIPVLLGELKVVHDELKKRRDRSG